MEELELELELDRELLAEEVEALEAIYGDDISVTPAWLDDPNT